MTARLDPPPKDSGDGLDNDAVVEGVDEVLLVEVVVLAVEVVPSSSVTSVALKVLFLTLDDRISSTTVGCWIGSESILILRPNSCSGSSAWKCDGKEDTPGEGRESLTG